MAGGKSMGMVKPIPYGRQSIDDEDIAAVVEVLRGDWLTQGPNVQAFENAITEATGARYAVAVSNGTAALHLACLAAEVQPGDFGITSTNTFLASANCIRYAGGTALFTDINPRTGLMCLESLQKHIAELSEQGKRPKVIIPVDFSGSVADLGQLHKIAQETGSSLIEDAAHSLGATYQCGGETYVSGCCQHSEMAIFSFHPVKHITSGEGGAITTNSEELYQRLLLLRNHGMTKDSKLLHKNDGPWYYEQHALGYNYRITDMQCALGLSQIKKLPRFVQQRREIADRYRIAFATKPLEDKLFCLEEPSNTTSSYHLFVICLKRQSGETLEQLSQRRRFLYDGLREDNIFTQVHYIPVHQQPNFQTTGASSPSLPGADEYYASCLSLPMFPTLTAQEQEYVIERIAHRLTHQTR
jgi:perosamine synthetase